MRNQSTPTEARPLVALAGGKSGGHVFPALAVAEELVELGAQVVFFGMSSGMERRLAEERGVPFVAIDAAPLVGRGPLQRVAAVFKLVVNAWRARGELSRRKTVAVLATGGFVSAPTVVGARLAGIPIVLLEPNAEPGSANRLLSRFAQVAAVAFEETRNELACPSEVLGVPVRAEFASVAALETASDRTRLLAVGGSQGAARLNAELPALITSAINSGTVVHQCGANNLQETRQRWLDSLDSTGASAGPVQERSSDDDTSCVLRSGDLEVKLVSFIDDMPSALGAADLVISRAGAITLAELSAAGRPAVLIPLPLAGAHQLGNAKRQAGLGCAEVVEQDELERLGPLLTELIADPERIVAMAAAARGSARPAAARDIARLTRDTAVRAGRWAA